jgi:K+-transporting ATPase ATPase C chain
MKSLLSTLRPAIGTILLLTLLLGGVYPLVTTGILQLAFKDQAQGSLIRDSAGRIIGSRLIGQSFDQPQYMWGRLSATGPTPYNAGASSGSNLGVNNPALMEAVKGRLQALETADPGNAKAVPVDLVTASGSGLDPDISLAAAAYQAGRIARARGISEETVVNAISKSTHGRDLGILGEPRVNVLEVNLRLDGKLP